MFRVEEFFDELFALHEGLGIFAPILFTALCSGVQHGATETSSHEAARKGTRQRLGGCLKQVSQLTRERVPDLLLSMLQLLIGHQTVVDFLLRQEADHSAIDQKGITPLHLAVVSGHLPVVERLVKAKASINAQTPDGFTPLYCSILQGDFSIVNYLVSSEASLTLKSSEGFTALHAAVIKGETRIIELLLRREVLWMLKM